MSAFNVNFLVVFVCLKIMPTIKLQSSDGEIFEVDVEIAKQSVTIKTMLEGIDDTTATKSAFCSHLMVLIFLFDKAYDVCHLWLTDLGMDDDGDDDPVPLPNVNAAILKKVTGSKDTQTQHTACTNHTAGLCCYSGSVVFTLVS